MKKLTIMLAVFLLASNICLAAEIKSQTARFTIVEDKAVFQSAYEFPEPSTGIIRVPAPSDAEVIEAYVDGEKVEATVKDSTIVINLNSSSKAKVSYITKEFIDKTNFLMNMPIAYDTDYLKLILVLPEGATLKTEIADMAGSIYPKPDKTGTDGRSLIFIWEMESLKQGDEFSVFAMYEPKTGEIPAFALLAIIALALAAYYFYTKPRHEKKQENHAEKQAREKPEKELEILEHLKEDEKQIIRVLKQREGSCEQGTLRVVTGFSKAHLSRLLSELEARKIVFKEKRGKKNLVFLK